MFWHFDPKMVNCYITLNSYRIVSIVLMIWISIYFASSKSLEGKQLRKERRDVSKPIGCCFSFRPTPSRSPWANQCRRILCVFITPPSTPSRTCSRGPKRELGKPQHWLKSLCPAHWEGKGDLKHCIWKLIRIFDQWGAFVNLKPYKLILWESELLISMCLLWTFPRRCCLGGERWNIPRN